MKIKIKKYEVCRKEYEVEAIIDGKEVQLLAGWAAQDNETQLHVMYGDNAEAVGAEYGDDVESGIEAVVIKTIQGGKKCGKCDDDRKKKGAK